MAGLLRRSARVLRGLMSGLLTPAEDPRQGYANTFQRHHDLLAKIQLGISELKQAHQRLSEKASNLGEKVEALAEEARGAVRQGRDDIARLLLQRRQAAVTQLRVLEENLRDVELEEQRLGLIESQLSSKLEAFYARQEVIAARFSAAEAQVRIQETLAGLSDELSDMEQILEGTEEKTERMQARAYAIDRLIDEGMLESRGALDLDLGAESATGDPKDEQVEDLLRAFKREAAAEGDSTTEG